MPKLGSLGLARLVGLNLMLGVSWICRRVLPFIPRPRAFASLETTYTNTSSDTHPPPSVDTLTPHFYIPPGRQALSILLPLTKVRMVQGPRI